MADKPVLFNQVIAPAALSLAIPAQTAHPPNAWLVAASCMDQFDSKPSVF